MKRIEYFSGCETQYLISLGLIDKSKGTFTGLYKELYKEWKQFRRQYCFFPEEVKDILICPYEKLVDYFIFFNKEIFKETKRDYQQFKNKLENINKFFDVSKYFKYNYNKKGDKHFSDKIAEFFIQYENEINIYSCFYCDSAYAGVFEQTNLNVEKKRRTFDVDHFFPNAQYPMFSLSLYNFVPSCQICNSRIKGSSNFLQFYQFIKVDSNIIVEEFEPTNAKEELLLISPLSQKYNFSINLKLHVFPKSNTINHWHYHPKVSNNVDDYSIIFDINEKLPYKKEEEAFMLEDRYNTIAIKFKALYLLDLKRKYPDSNIKMMSNILQKEDKLKKISKFQQLKNAIFHEDEKYALLQKLRNDILND